MPRRESLPKRWGWPRGTPVDISGWKLADRVLLAVEANDLNVPSRGHCFDLLRRQRRAYQVGHDRLLDATGVAPAGARSLTRPPAPGGQFGRKSLASCPRQGSRRPDVPFIFRRTVSAC